MRKKIKEALKLRYGTRADKELGHLQLGLSDEVFERVAASVETFITEENAIAGFVESEATLNLLKSYQSEADRARTQARAAGAGNGAGSSENNGGQPSPGQAGNPGSGQADGTPDIAAIINAALDEKLKPLTDRIAGFEAERARQTAIDSLDRFMDGWDYAKGFPKESAEAKRIALKLYKAGGEKMSGDELVAAFREEFEPAVQAKGDFDFSKPYKGEGGAGQDETDYSSFDRAMKELGWETKAAESNK